MGLIINLRNKHLPLNIRLVQHATTTKGTKNNHLKQNLHQKDVGSYQISVHYMPPARANIVVLVSNHSHAWKQNNIQSAHCTHKTAIILELAQRKDFVVPSG